MRPEILSRRSVLGLRVMLASAYVCCSTSTLKIGLEGDTRRNRLENKGPFAHESLYQLEVCYLVIDQGQNRLWFSHHYEEQSSVVVRSSGSAGARSNVRVNSTCHWSVRGISRDTRQRIQILMRGIVWIFYHHRLSPLGPQRLDSRRRCLPPAGTYIPIWVLRIPPCLHHSVRKYEDSK